MRISVITPSFNQLEWLRLCVASVADQVGADIGCHEHFSVEHIIQDAGTPGIDELAREVGANFYREGRLLFRKKTTVAANGTCYRVEIHSESDGGMYDAINRGLRKAGGEYASYLNCDEQYLPGSLAFVGKWFEQNAAAEVAFGDAIIVNSRGEYVCDRRVIPPSSWHTRISGNLSFFTAATFFRTEAIVGKGLFFDPAWKAVGDAVWALSLLRNKVRMGVIRRALAIHTDTGANLILSDSAVEESRRLAASASCLALLAKPMVLFWYRIRRALAGAYNIAPHTYTIYTSDSPRLRRQFNVFNPTHVWPGR